MNDKARILVIDDEDCVLKLMATVLQFHGYDVLTAGDAHSALEQCQLRLPDLILSDVHLHPAFTGWELVRHLRLSHPEIKALMVSGLSDKQWVEQELGTTTVDFLAKPFSPGELAIKVRETLMVRPLAVT